MGFKIEWHAKEVINEIRKITSQEERAVAERIRKRAKKKVPVGTRRHQGRKPSQSRYPGRLRRSIKIFNSRYPDGGYLVWAGDEKYTWYARFVEYGTIFMRKRGGYRYLRGAVSLEKSRFTRQLKKRLGV